MDRPVAATTSADSKQSAWSYEQAFCRNLGLLSAAEQERLRESRVAIAGLGGVGGVHLMTLARLGIGKFAIADPDVFETANFNRQAGASIAALGRAKVDVMAELARGVNPELEIRAWREAVTPENIDEFLRDVDLVVDGVDFFALDARRRLFAEARRRGVWAHTAGPIGFSAAWLSFDPGGMSFDAYFDLRDNQSALEQLIAFAVGLTPKATHLAYLDLSKVKPEAGVGPSSALACQLCSGVAAAEALKILLRRGVVRAAPYYFQFDAYRQKFCRGRLRAGNRHPWQRVKRRWLLRRFAKGENTRQAETR
jgi:molybdopterin/thiamine biosynthesis adenylyltransferase